MIPIDKFLIKECYEFEGASTYEYAHDQVKASGKTTSGSDLYNIVKKEDMIDHNEKRNTSRINIKPIQDDLIRLDTSIESLKEESKQKIAETKPTA